MTACAEYESGECEMCCKAMFMPAGLFCANVDCLRGIFGRSPVLLNDAEFSVLRTREEIRPYRR